MGGAPARPSPLHASAAARCVADKEALPSPCALLSFSLLARPPSLPHAEVIETLALLCRTIAAVTPRPLQIAAAESFEVVSSTSSPSRACWDTVIAPESTINRSHTDRTSSTVPKPSSLPVPLRPLRSLRGELARLPDPFPLFPVACSLDTVVVSRCHRRAIVADVLPGETL